MPTVSEQDKRIVAASDLLEMYEHIPPPSAKLKQKQISEFNEAQKTVKAEQIAEDKRIDKINKNELEKLAKATEKNQKIN